MKKIKAFILLSMLAISGLSAHQNLISPKKIYIDEQEFATQGDDFHIHMGNNIWLVTNTIHKDDTGLFAYEANIRRSMTNNGIEREYVKKWKCPYCYMYWPIGKACQNEECPSRYK